MKLDILYKQGKKTLAQAPTADPGLEAFFLLQKVFGVSRADLLLGDLELPGDGAAAFLSLVERRLGGEPLQYILGEWEFFGLPMAVGEGVLIPRPETELLAEGALAELTSPQGLPSPALLDLCSGSGCIPIAVAHHRPDVAAWGVERSLDAFRYFAENVARNKTPSVTPVLGDVFALPAEITCRQYRVITANPPYVASGALAKLPPEVRREPALALDGGADGLDFIRALAGIGLPLLLPGGLLLLEIGEEQGEAAASILRSAGYECVAVQKDPAGLDRVVQGRRTKE